MDGHECPQLGPCRDVDRVRHIRVAVVSVEKVRDPGIYLAGLFAAFDAHYFSVPPCLVVNTNALMTAATVPPNRIPFTSPMKFKPKTSPANIEPAIPMACHFLSMGAPMGPWVIKRYGLLGKWEAIYTKAKIVLSA